MPELPEVETVRRSLLPQIVGRRVFGVTVYDARLRQAVDVDEVTASLMGRSFVDIRRRAKYLLFDTDADAILLFHLGMSGQLRVVNAGAERRKHDHVVLDVGGGVELRFNDPRRFGVCLVMPRDGEATHPLLAHLGVEPLSAAFQGAALFAMTRKAKKPIKNFIMDGTRLVGVGNIYACESLFMAGIHPERPAHTLSRLHCEALAKSIQSTLSAAIAEGGTTLRNFADAEGREGYFAVSLGVYGREDEPCMRCKRLIVRKVQAGRSTFFCSYCQT